MRHSFLAVAAIALLAPPPTTAADLPPIVIQIAPPSKVLDDTRGMARVIGGDKRVKQFNDGFRKNYGEEGLAAVDLNRPIVFGAYLRPDAPKGKEAYGFGMISLNDEKGFLELLKKDGGKLEPQAGKKGRYQYASNKNFQTEGPICLQIQGGLAVAGFNIAEAEFDPSKYPDVEKLVNPGETGTYSARVYFDRFPADQKKKLAQMLDQSIEEFWKEQFSPNDPKGFRKAAEKFGVASRRHASQVQEASEAVLRFVYDPASADVALELGLTGKPGTRLTQDIASLKPTTNRFAGLLGLETVGGLKFSLPLTNTDLREGVALLIETGGQKGQDSIPAPARPMLEELVKGLARTVRAGEFDIAVGLNGPDKDGLFTAVAGVSYDDPAALEKLLRKLLDDQAPLPFKDVVQLDADKASGVNIHLAKLGVFLPEEPKKAFGAEAALAFAFAPQGLYVVFGTNPIPALKAALALKPREARLLDLVLNPNRLEKLVNLSDGESSAIKVKQLLGIEDKLVSAFFINVDGGAELKVALGMNLKVIPRIVFEVLDALSHQGTLGEAKPAP